MKSKTAASLLITATLLMFLTALTGLKTYAASLAPDPVSESNLTIQVAYVNRMPSAPGVSPNLASPVVVKGSLFLIDQNDAIYRLNRRGRVREIFNVSEAPDGLALDNRQSILNISPGRRDRIFVMFTSGSEPTTDIPLFRLPDPLPGDCCDIDSPVHVPDLYRVGTNPNVIYKTRTEYQVLYEYRLSRNGLRQPRAIVAFETQSGTAHGSGGMTTMPDGRVLFATGDALPFGTDGRNAPQVVSEHVGKLLLINPADGSIEVAGQGLRNVQKLELTTSFGQLNLGFADIGGVTAEEINFVSAADILDSSQIENFGWGRSLDGLAREGTFYIGPGTPFVLVTEPPAVGEAPSPESGYIQPHAQFGRVLPGDTMAVSGPVTSQESFTSITALFGDLVSGLVYATTAPRSETDAEVFAVNLVDEDGNAVASLNDLAGGRADPRFFRFPDGSAGVLLEATGELFRLVEVSQ